MSVITSNKSAQYTDSFRASPDLKNAHENPLSKKINFERESQEINSRNREIDGKSRKSIKNNALSHFHDYIAQILIYKIVLYFIGSSPNLSNSYRKNIKVS